MSEPMSDERLERIRKIFLDAKVIDWYRKELQELFDEMDRLRAERTAIYGLASIVRSKEQHIANLERALDAAAVNHG